MRRVVLWRGGVEGDEPTLVAAEDAAGAERELRDILGLPARVILNLDRVQCQLCEGVWQAAEVQLFTLEHSDGIEVCARHYARLVSPPVERLVRLENRLDTLERFFE